MPVELVELVEPVELVELADPVELVPLEEEVGGGPPGPPGPPDPPGPFWKCLMIDARMLWADDVFPDWMALLRLARSFWNGSLDDEPEVEDPLELDGGAFLAAWDWI